MADVIVSAILPRFGLAFGGNAPYACRTSFDACAHTRSSMAPRLVRSGVRWKEVRSSRRQRRAS